MCRDPSTTACQVQRVWLANHWIQEWHKADTIHILPSWLESHQPFHDKMTLIIYSRNHLFFRRRRNHNMRSICAGIHQPRHAGYSGFGWQASGFKSGIRHVQDISEVSIF